MEQLLQDLFAMPDAAYCPHGRPIIIRFSMEEIEEDVQTNLRNASASRMEKREEYKWTGSQTLKHG